MTSVTVLHGLLTRDGALALWAEGPPGEGPDGERGAHPAAVPAVGESRSVTLLLPSTSAGPVPSPQLGLPPRRGKPRLRPWRVPAVIVPFVTADLADAQGARPAPSLDYLVEVCAFAAELVARGRVLPAVRTTGRRARAFWRPVLTGPDATRHAELIQLMPPACRAERVRPGEVDGLPAADTLHTALESLVDGLVRTRLAEANVTLSGAPWLVALAADPDPPALVSDADRRRADSLRRFRAARGL